MLKFAYVRHYQLGERVEIPVAEELLAAYNDFYSSNLEVLQGQLKTLDVDEEVGEDDEADYSQAEKQAAADVKAFSDAWGSLDFASATLVGLDIDWDAIQEKMMAEQSKHIRPGDSALIPVAATLRKVASILAYSERLVTRLKRKAVEPEVIKTIIKGCDMLLHQVKDQNIDIPELDGAAAKQLAKIKTVDGLLELAQQLFSLGKGKEEA